MMNHLILGQRIKIRMKQETKKLYGIADAHGIESFITAPKKKVSV